MWTLKIWRGTWERRADMGTYIDVVDTAILCGLDIKQNTLDKAEVHGRNAKCPWICRGTEKSGAGKLEGRLHPVPLRSQQCRAENRPLLWKWPAHRFSGNGQSAVPVYILVLRALPRQPDHQWQIYPPVGADFRIRNLSKRENHNSAAQKLLCAALLTTI